MLNLWTPIAKILVATTNRIVLLFIVLWHYNLFPLQKPLLSFSFPVCRHQYLVILVKLSTLTLDHCCVLFGCSIRRTICTFRTGWNHFLYIMKIMFVICEPAHEVLCTYFPSEKSMQIMKRVCMDPIMYIGRFKVKSWVILIQYSLIAYFWLSSSAKLLCSILDTHQLFMTCNFEVSK